MSRTASVAMFLTILSAPAGVMAELAAPFRTRNLSPPVAIFALPSWQPRRQRTEVGATLELANHYRLSRSADDFLLLDGETLRLNLFAERPIGDRWSVGVEVPWVRQHGGVLDDAVDGWHSIFGLPDGGRNARPEDAIEYRVGRGADTMIALDRSADSLGDMLVSIARSAGADRNLTFRLTAKLPTGDEAILAGSGTTDWMATVLGRRRVAFRAREAGYYWGGGVVVPGTPKRLRLPGEDVVLTGLVGGTVALGERFGLKSQIEVHTPYFDTPLEELGQTSVQISFGGWWQLDERARLDFAVGEDLHVSTAPDVVIHGGVSWRW